MRLGYPTGLTPRRLSNGTYPASNDTGSNTPELSHRPDDLPTVEERISGIIERYEDRVFEPVSTVHGRKLREEVLEEPETVTRNVEIGESEEKTTEETVSRGSLPLIAAIQEMLEWYRKEGIAEFTDLQSQQLALSSLSNTQINRLLHFLTLGNAFENRNIEAYRDEYGGLYLVSSILSILYPPGWVKIVQDLRKQLF